jgi:hypothetical protein
MARHKMGKTSGRKKSTTGAKRSHRRKRVGASGKLEPTLMNGLAVGGGIVAMRELSILAGGVFPSLMASPMITGIVQVAAGGLLAWKGKNGFLMYMGLGGMGNGIMTVLNGAGIIGAAPQQLTYQFANRRQMGDPRLQFVAGPQTRIGSYPNTFAAVAGPKRHKNRYSS